MMLCSIFCMVFCILYRTILQYKYVLLLFSFFSSFFDVSKPVKNNSITTSYNVCIAQHGWFGGCDITGMDH